MKKKIIFHHSLHGLACKNRAKIALKELKRLTHSVHDEHRRKVKIILATLSSKKHPEGTVSCKLHLNSGKKKEMA